MFDHLEGHRSDEGHGEPDRPVGGQTHQLGLGQSPDTDARGSEPHAPADGDGDGDGDEAGHRGVAADGDETAGSDGEGDGGDGGGAPDYSVCDAEEVGVALDQVMGLHSACTLQYLRLVADLGRREVWKAEGQVSMANWLALRYKLARATARIHTRIAAVIDDLPAIAEAYGVGQISFDQLDALCQLADADTEAAWLAEAQGCDPEALRRAVRTRRIRDESTKEIRERRGFSFRADPQPGVTQIHGALEASDAEVVRTALDRLASKNATPDPDTGVYPSVPQQRADALVALCGMGLAADADLDRATVVVHGDIGLLTGEDPNGRATLADYTPIAAAAFQRLACDGRIEWSVDGHDGATLGIGRAERQWPAWLVRYIRRRDGQTCRFPGCNAPIHQIHHIDGWSADLGGTDDTNGIGLCWTHHHDVHEGGWGITGNPNGTVTFTSPNNRPYLSPCPGVTQHTLDLLDAPPHTYGRDPTHRPGPTHRGPPDRGEPDPDLPNNSDVDSDPPD